MNMTVVFWILASKKITNKSVIKQFENLIKEYAEKDTSSIISKSILELSTLSKQINKESFFQNKLNNSEVSNYFKKSEIKLKNEEFLKRKHQKSSQLHQYNENWINNDKTEMNNHNLKGTRKPESNEKAIEMISNHYSGTRTAKYQTRIEKSTKPSTDTKIIVNSGTLVRNLRTTDSSEMGTGSKI